MMYMLSHQKQYKFKILIRIYLRSAKINVIVFSVELPLPHDTSPSQRTL